MAETGLIRSVGESGSARDYESAAPSPGMPSDLCATCPAPAEVESLRRRMTGVESLIDGVRISVDKLSERVGKALDSFAGENVDVRERLKDVDDKLELVKSIPETMERMARLLEHVAAPKRPAPRPKPKAKPRGRR